MARSVMSDLLQVFPFWLLDAAPLDPTSLPFLTPIFGFSGITAPEFTMEVAEITEGNWLYKRKVIKSATATNMVLERGIVFYDSEFWRWSMAALSGNLEGLYFQIPGTPFGASAGGVSPRRTLLLVQFFTRLPFANATAASAGVAASVGSLAALGATLAGQGAAGIATGAGLTSAAVSAAQAVGGSSLGPFEFTARLPAKAWLLHGCLPVRYKASGDFDATSSQVSIAQVEVAVEGVEEISLVG